MLCKRIYICSKKNTQGAPKEPRSFSRLRSAMRPRGKTPGPAQEEQPGEAAAGAPICELVPVKFPLSKINNAG